jgi:hypothetical protein
LIVGWLGLFIAPTTKLAVWWGCLSHGALDSPVHTGHVWCASHVTKAVGFRPLELCLLGPPGCPWRTGHACRVPGAPAWACLTSACAGAHSMRCRYPLAPKYPLLRCHTRQSGVHRTCPVNYSGLAVANSRSWRVQEPLFLGAPDTVRCTPDSPVNYNGAPLDFPEGDEFDLESSGAPDTVRWCTGHCPWHTGQSGAPDQRCLRLSLCSFVEPNTWSFYWLSVNLWHLYYLYTREN